MYGKIIHTWQVDRGDALPLGPPQLMTSFTDANKGSLTQEELAAKDAVTGISSEQRAAARKDIVYKPRPEGVDQWETTGKGIDFKPELVPLKQ